MIEGWPLEDALYMTVLTVTTVGFQEVRPLSQMGRVFTMFLILAGVGGVLYILTAMVTFFVDRHLGAAWRRRRMKNKVEKLDRHFILCGYGRVGAAAAEKTAANTTSETRSLSIGHQGLIVGNFAP